MASHLYLGNLGIIDFNSDVTLTHSSNLLTIGGGAIAVQDTSLNFQKNSADDEACDITFNKSRNTTDGSHTIVDDNDILGLIEWYGSNGSAYTPAAAIFARVNGSPSATNDDMPTELVFATTADGAGDDEGYTERMVIDNAGNVGIGTTAPQQILHIFKICMCFLIL